VDGNFEDLEAQFKQKPGGSGGAKARKPGSRTSKVARKQAIVNSQQIRVQEAGAKLERDLVHFPFIKGNLETNLKPIETYKTWLLASLSHQPPTSETDKDLTFEPTHSSGPGGQNVNKVQSAIIARHTITGLFVKAEESRDQPQNKVAATTRLHEKLSQHIEDAKVYLSDRPTLESKGEKIMELLSGILAKN